MAAEAMESEFDVVAGWTEQVVADLGPDYAIPAGSRGSGDPSALAWLAEALEIGAARRVLDIGAGVGGAAAWLAEHFGTAPVCAEPMPAAAAAGRRLFGLPAVIAPAQRLPFRDGTFDAAWCLGVLCTTPAKAELLAEARRVLTATGRLGLLVLAATGPLPPPLPEGNEFPTVEEVRALLGAAGFAVLQVVDGTGLPPAPVSWQARADRVAAELADRHAGDPRWEQAAEQSRRVGRLLSAGHLKTVLVHATAA